MQLITNDKFMSAKHRVLAQKLGPRVSVACFLKQHFQEEASKFYGPIKELLIEENPPIYKEITMIDLVKQFYPRRVYDASRLEHFRL
ncbi:hypothetical protein PIB30_054808 [Stylosanthes scabra]|uniref:Uncharacterized protein n=1 Tax=Stylosanthes scabra TaxID=79078 RepID=A0ABU6WH67_9FABA|nr:hypothetical protein [Stylosanthes scabra]